MRRDPRPLVASRARLVREARATAGYYRRCADVARDRADEGTARFNERRAAFWLRRADDLAHAAEAAEGV